MAHHEPLKALGPIDWTDVTGDDLSTFLSTTFSSAQTVIDSIPALPGQQQQTNRARSHTDSSVLVASSSSQPSSSPDDPTTTTTTTKTGRNHANTTAGADAAAAAAASAATAAQLLKEWKEVKVPPKDNPMDISVFKLGGKDGRGAWFARRSLHEGVPFDKFRMGLEREFGETMKNSKGPGTGNVRGIGAERRAERVVCEGVGKAEVWLLSAQFPGPTTPRDFLTLLLTGGSGLEEGEGKGKGKGNGPRQFMVVSRPCNHPECQPRTGYIRGNYESVEIIREVPTEKPVRRVRSSTDLSGRQDKPNGSEDAGPEAGRVMSQSLSKLPDTDAEDASADKAATETEMAIEWIMVTRSDPGGSVPRFMVEKGTPGGIVNDAGRFIKWLDSKKVEDLQEPLEDNLKDGAVKNDDSEPPTSTRDPSSTDVPPGALPETTELSSSQEDIQPSGFYNMIAGALGAMASRLPGITASATGTHTDTDDSDSDSEGSERSFASAHEVDPETPLAKTTAVPPSGGDNTTGAAGGENASTHSTRSDESSSKASLSQHEKALKKLQERQRKLDEKMARQQERNAQSKQNQGDDALAKLKEKHDREIARQEENYRKEVKKLEEKRLKEEKKAEEKRRKQQEKEERENVSMQLEKVKVERDVALKQIEILKEQVGELQAQNTKLALQLGQASKSEESIASGARKSDEEKSS
ncbi:hypothetical protein VM1G_00158 [Cytospora mali]|uniref:DUF3074 domain-containing protein n=1 Tax=Cytospora mali TaxID=578113 RepID=A0A194VNM7_CYTMA|nr:hypothetical protein VM1G_00158 [Valsa mali]